MEKAKPRIKQINTGVIHNGPPSANLFFKTVCKPLSTAVLLSSTLVIFSSGFAAGAAAVSVAGASSTFSVLALSAFFVSLAAKATFVIPKAIMQNTVNNAISFFIIDV